VSVQTVREIPKDLPPACLFLDDIDEITKILLESSEAEELSLSAAEPRVIQYKIKDKFTCDALSDLQALGGAVTQFEVAVGYDRLMLNRNMSRWYIWSTNPEIRLATYAKLVRVFEARKLKLKAGILDLPGLSGFVLSIPIAASLYLVMALAVAAGAGSVHGKTIAEVLSGRKGEVALASALLFGTIAAWSYLLLSHSVVKFRYSHEDRSLYQALRSSNPLLVAVVAAIAGAVVYAFFERVFKWLWP